MSEVRDFIKNKSYISLISSRVMEIFDYTTNKEKPLLNVSLDNRCKQCLSFAVYIADCHLCGNQFCRRCVHYFMLPDKFYPDSDAMHNEGYLKLPVTVCWSCHDVCIFNRLNASKDDTFVGIRSNMVVKKIENAICLMLPKNIKDGKFVNKNKFQNCIVCDKENSQFLCQLCGEYVCEKCSSSIPLLPDEFRLSQHETSSRSCNECRFKICGKFSIATWYLSVFTLKDKIFQSEREKPNVKNQEELVKLEIDAFVKKARYALSLETEKETPNIDGCFACGDPFLEQQRVFCHICNNSFCKCCTREFYVSANDEMNEFESAHLEPFCWSCHDIALAVRYSILPPLKPIRHRKFLLMDDAKKIVYYPPILRDENDEPANECFFCRKEQKPTKTKNCFFCNEQFCKADIYDQPDKNAFVCFECRQLLIVKKFEAVESTRHKLSTQTIFLKSEDDAKKDEMIGRMKKDQKQAQEDLENELWKNSPGKRGKETEKDGEAQSLKDEEAINREAIDEATEPVNKKTVDDETMTIDEDDAKAKAEAVDNSETLLDEGLLKSDAEPEEKLKEQIAPLAEETVEAESQAESTNLDKTDYEKEKKSEKREEVQTCSKELARQFEESIEDSVDMNANSDANQENDIVKGKHDDENPDCLEQQIMAPEEDREVHLSNEEKKPKVRVKKKHRRKKNKSATIEDEDKLEEETGSNTQSAGSHEIKPRSIEITVKKMPLGMSIDESTMLVSSVEKKSFVHRRGARTGQRLVSVNDQPASMELLNGQLPLKLKLSEH